VSQSVCATTFPLTKIGPVETTMSGRVPPTANVAPLGTVRLSTKSTAASRPSASRTTLVVTAGELQPQKCGTFTVGSLGSVLFVLKNPHRSVPDTGTRPLGIVNDDGRFDG
jgi:hypothetical protein